MDCESKPLPADILVVGGDGLIGHALVDRFRSMAMPVRYTSRRQNPRATDFIYLDLAQSPKIDYSPSVVFICAGVTDLRLCEKAPFETRRINVDATLDLAAKLYAGGSTVVYLSSHAVFDGSVPYAPTNEPVRPTTEYGWQKAKVEQGILAMGGRTAVVRMPKVVSCKVPLFAQWLSCLSNGCEINPLSDLSLSPISLNYLTAALAADHLSGIVHLSGVSQVTYVEFALELAKALGVSRSLVRPTTAKEMNIALVYAPRHTSLDMRNTTAALGIEPQTLSAVVSDLVREFFQSCDSARSGRHHNAQNDPML